MTFEPVTSDSQINQTAELAKEIWTDHFTPIIGPDQVNYMLDTIQSADAITNQIRHQKYQYFLITPDRYPIGYFAILYQTDELFLSKLYIQKQMRSKGCARQTLDYIKSIAHKKNIRKITLTVNKNNPGPIAAYEKLGFINKGSIIKDIGSGFIMDDFQMELNLQ